MRKDGEVYNKQYLIRGANKKTVEEISEEIERSRQSEEELRGFVFSKGLRKAMCILPRWLVLAFMRALLRNHEKVKELAGTVFVTSVSMFSKVPGYILP